MKYLALMALFLTIAALVVMGGVIFVPFLFGLFLLALVGVLGGLKDRTVRQHNPAMNPRRWRDGS
jgi:uncharacterized protein (DUF58 family)